MTTDTSVPDLTQALALKIDLLSNTDPAWVTFVNDHISYIRQNSRIVTSTMQHVIVIVLNLNIFSETTSVALMSFGLLL